MAIHNLHTAGEVRVNDEKFIVVQRVQIVGGRTDQVRLEARERVETDTYKGFTKQAVYFTSPEQALEFAALIAGEANAWGIERDGKENWYTPPVKPAAAKKAPVKAARPTVAKKSAAAKRVASRK